jgi:methionyl-tRNA formyltransferase
VLNGERVWIWAAHADGDPSGLPRAKPGEVMLDSDGWPWVATTDGWIRVVTIQREGGPKVSGQAAGKTFLPAGSAFAGLKESAK